MAGLGDLRNDSIAFPAIINIDFESKFVSLSLSEAKIAIFIVFYMNVYLLVAKYSKWPPNVL